jgi:hypothetical protein
MRTLVYIASLFRQRKRGTKQRKSLKTRRAERELFFWTVAEALDLSRQTLRLLLLAALVIYAIVSLVEGRLPGVESILRSL